MSIFKNQKVQKENEVFNIIDDININLPYGFSKFFKHYKEKNDLQYVEYKNFIELTKGKKVLIDVGSHIGVFPFTFNSLEDNRHSFGFEINPLNISAFLDILKINNNKKYDNITLYDIPISNDFSEKYFSIMSDNPDLVNNQKGYQGVIEVENRNNKLNKDWDFTNIDKAPEKYKLKKKCETVDNFCDFLMTEMGLMVDVVKIDVEGYEQKVLNGAQKTFKNIRPLMFIEIHQKYLPSYNSDIVDIYNHIKDLNYVMYDYNRKKIESIEQYESLFENLTELRVYCIHKSKKG